MYIYILRLIEKTISSFTVLQFLLRILLCKLTRCPQSLSQELIIIIVTLHPLSLFPIIIKSQAIINQRFFSGKQLTSSNSRSFISLIVYVWSGLCSSRALSPLAPNFCSWVTRKSQIFHTNHNMLGALDFTGSEHWTPFNFP